MCGLPTLKNSKKEQQTPRGNQFCEDTTNKTYLKLEQSQLGR